MTRGRYNGQGGRYNDQGVGTMTRGRYNGQGGRYNGVGVTRNNGRNLNFYKFTGEVGIMARRIGIMTRE